MFNDDPDVIKLVADVMPMCAVFQFFDAISSVEGGILRGQGRQHLGGVANVIVYWVIALPTGLTLAFKAGWGLHGLWAGMVVSGLGG
jgi:multidrug resistance protein, MATE family